MLLGKAAIVFDQVVVRSFTSRFDLVRFIEKHTLNNELKLTSSLIGRRNAARGPAAYPNGRRVRRVRAADGWTGVWQSIFDRIHFDIDFPFEEDDNQSDNASEIQRRENQEWERRFQMARIMGAGSRWRPRYNPTLFREASPERNPESQEELRAWNQFDKAREQLAAMDNRSVTSNSSSRRRRKRKSVDSSPAESDRPEPQPERKLKRPRARLTIDPGPTAGESSTAALHRRSEQLKTPPAVAESSAAPGFLQALLDEVGTERPAERDRDIAAPQPRRVIRDRACSPQNSSPGLSPIYPTPHGMVRTHYPT
jgi:hypothetical protein